MPKRMSAKNQNIPDNFTQVINPQIRPKETSNEITKVTHIFRETSASQKQYRMELSTGYLKK